MRIILLSLLILASRVPINELCSSILSHIQNTPPRHQEFLIFCSYIYTSHAVGIDTVCTSATVHARRRRQNRAERDHTSAGLAAYNKKLIQ